MQDFKDATAFGNMESHIDDFKMNGGATWETVRLMAKGVKEFSGTSMQEEFVLESVAKVSTSSECV